MDGTLLDTVCCIPERNIEAIEKAINQGVIIVPTTGRCYRNTKMILGDLQGISYYVTSNGAIVSDDSKQEIIYEKVMAKEQAKAVHELTKKYSVFVEIYAGLDTYVDNKGIDNLYRSALKTEHCDQILISPEKVEDLSMVINDDSISVNKYYIVFEKGETSATLLDEIAGIDGLYPIAPTADTIEVISGKWSKRDGLEKLIGKLGIAREEVMVIGDSDNDYEMMEWSSNAVAMGNAPDRIKELANYITATNNEAGVAQAIQELVLWS